MERYCTARTAGFVPTNKNLPKFKRVHESFLSPKLFSAKVKRFFVISVLMKLENRKTGSVNENENKENENVDEFKKQFLQQKPANTKSKNTK